jgi:hypothetical protein
MPPQCRPRRHRIKPFRGLQAPLPARSHHMLTFCNPAPPRGYKRSIHGSFHEDRRKKGTNTASQRKIQAGYSPGPCEVTSRVAHTHFLQPRLETWELLPLSRPLVTPTTSTSVQDNTELSSPTGRRAFLGLNQYKSSVFFLHTIRTPNTQTLITRWC